MIYLFDVRIERLYYLFMVLMSSAGHATKEQHDDT